MIIGCVFYLLICVIVILSMEYCVFFAMAQVLLILLLRHVLSVCSSVKIFCKIFTKYCFLYINTIPVPYYPFIVLLSIPHCDHDSGLLLLLYYRVACH